MTQRDIELEIKAVMLEFKEARQLPISSWLDELTLKLDALYNLLDLYEGA